MAAPKTGSGKTRANRYREDNQKLLVERLQGYGFIDQTLKNVKDLEDLTKEMEPGEIVRIKAASDLRMKLLDKLVPRRKAVEITGEGGAPIEMKWEVEVVEVAKATNS